MRRRTDPCLRTGAAPGGRALPPRLRIGYATGRERPPASRADRVRYLLARGECSRWHRVDADEGWHWQEGDALELLRFDPASNRLQAARPLGDCAVSPGLVPEGLELLDAGDDMAARLHALGAPLL